MTNKAIVQVALRLTGRFEPSGLTRRIELAPTKTWRLGEFVQSTQLKRNSDGWMFGIPERAEHDANVILCDLLDKIEPYREKIIAAAREFNLGTDISFGIYLRGESPAFLLPADTVRRVSAFGANLDIDLILAE